MDSTADTPSGVGCPIRKSSDQRSLPSPRSLSQGATSFIASRCQGIHQMPFSSLESLAFDPPCAGTSPNARRIRSCETPRMSSPPHERQPASAPTKTSETSSTTLAPQTRRRPHRRRSTREARPERTRIRTRPDRRRAKPLHTVQDHTQIHGGRTGLAPTPPPSAYALAHSPRQPRRTPVGWWSRTESNRRPPACKAGALPTELRPPKATG